MNKTIRKWFVTLKRHPHYIPLVLYAIACCVYTFNLTAHSNASMYVTSQVVALYVFGVTLFSILVIFSFINAYGKRQPRKPLMLAVVYLLSAAQMVMDALYIYDIYYETTVRENLVKKTADIVHSYNGTIMHLILLTVAVLLVITLPLYRKALAKIRNSAPDDEFTELSEDESLLVEEETWS